MKYAKLPLKELEAIAATRFVFGVGAALLLGHLLPESYRRWIGWALVIIGAASTPPLIYDVYHRRLR